MQLLKLFTLTLSIVSAHKSKHRHLKSMILNDRTMAERAFLITYVETKGFLLMKADKKRKGEHLQLPGGRIDPQDYEALNVTDQPDKLSLDEFIRVGQHAALRELKEETSIDFSGDYNRVQYLPGVTRAVAKHKPKHGVLFEGKFPRKLYYLLEIAPEEWDKVNITLSSEHIGFELQPDIQVAVEAVKSHSGGDSAEALSAFQQEMETFLIHI